jgi:exodeoxyribonuclease-3
VGKGFWEWAAKQKLDVICLQELKAHEEQIPAEILTAKGWYKHFHPAVKPGYSGVGILTRIPPEKIHKGLGWRQMDDEGRYIQADYQDLSVISVYLPSGASGEKRQQIKFKFLERFQGHLIKLRKKKRQFILCGDFNIAHKQIDLKNWRSNQKNSGFLPEERAWLDEVFGALGYVDAFRVMNQEAEQYTWWSNRGQAYLKNVGWRLDYHIVTPGLKDKIKAVSIYKEQKFSDHAPLIIDYNHTI